MKRRASAARRCNVSSLGRDADQEKRGRSRLLAFSSLAATLRTSEISILQTLQNLDLLGSSSDPEQRPSRLTAETSVSVLQFAASHRHRVGILAANTVAGASRRPRCALDENIIEGAVCESHSVCFLGCPLGKRFPGVKRYTGNSCSSRYNARVVDDKHMISCGRCASLCARGAVGRTQIMLALTPWR